MQGKLKDPGGNVLLTLKNNTRYTIGRDRFPGEDHLNLEDLYVSRLHGYITCDTEAFYYEDAGSRNGSRISMSAAFMGSSPARRNSVMRMPVPETEAESMMNRFRPAKKPACWTVTESR